MPTSYLKTLVFLQQKRQQENELTIKARRERDRQIGLMLAEKNITSPDGQIESWLSQIVSPEEERFATQIERGRSLISLVMILLGLIVGGLLVTGLFQYDGLGRVNLIYVLSVLVGLQLFLLLLTLLAMLPAPLTRWMPGFSSLQQLLQWLSPGRLQALVSRLFPIKQRTEIQQLLGVLGQNQKLFSGIGKWQVFSWSQLFGVAFNMGALMTVFLLIAVKDIAFGWSTTLQVQSENLLQITNLLALPWQAWLPVALPDLELVEASRYFRLQNGREGVVVDPELLGQWWPFIMLCIASYGLIPRLIALFFCRLNLARSMTQAICYFPGRQELLDRMNTAIVETHAEQFDSAAVTTTESWKKVAAEKNRSAISTIVLINWSSLDLREKPLLEMISQAGHFMVSALYDAGSSCGVDEDLRAVRSVSESDPDEPVGVLVKAWEPPLGELADFLMDLRDGCSRERLIRIIPVAIGAEGLVVPDKRDLDEWQRFVTEMADPWMSITPIFPRNDDG